MASWDLSLSSASLPLIIPSLFSIFFLLLPFFLKSLQSACASSVGSSCHQRSSLGRYAIRRVTAVACEPRQAATFLRNSLAISTTSLVKVGIFGILIPNPFQQCPFCPVKVNRKLTCFSVQLKLCK